MTFLKLSVGLVSLQDGELQEFVHSLLVAGRSSQRQAQCELWASPQSLALSLACGLNIQNG